MLPAAERANQHMVDRLITEGALWSPDLIGAFRATPRHRFLDRVYQYQRKRDRWRELLTRDPGEDELRLIYSDRALITHVSSAGRQGSGVPISSSSQPSLMAQMLEDLRLMSGLQVLEIGSGTGFNAALLAFVISPGEVVSVDVDREVLSEAWDHLRAFPDRKVSLKHADGREGFVEAAPYDRIMVTAATPDLEPAWLEQLAEGGILLAPLVLAPGLAFIVRGTVCKGEFLGRLTRAAYFMPLRAEGERGEAEDCPWPLAAEMHTVQAPWAGWFDRRRPRGNWLDFIQALVFFGHVRGLAVQHRSPQAGEPMYGLNDRGTVCWLGSSEWQVNGEPARELGWALWRAFLDAGGPRPTEYTLRASPIDTYVAVQGQGFHLRGSLCEQYWEQVDPIERSIPFE